MIQQTPLRLTCILLIAVLQGGIACKREGVSVSPQNTVPAAVNVTRYVSDETGFSFDLPEGWQVRDHAVGDMGFERLADDGYVYRFNVFIDSWSLDDPAEEIELALDLARALGGKELESGEAMVNGRSAKWMLTEEHGFYNLTYVMLSPGKKVQLRFNHWNTNIEASRKHFEQHRPIYEQMARSFELK